MAEVKVFGGRWRVVAQLGRGGQGTVYKVADTAGLASDVDLMLQFKEAMRQSHSPRVESSHTAMQ